MWWAVNRVAEAKVAQAEAKAAQASAEAMKTVAEAAVAAAKAESAAERRMLIDLRDRLPGTTAALSNGQTLQQEIESSLGHLMRRLGATESSVLVRDPDPDSEYLFFLALHGRAAGQLRKILVGRDSIAGKALRGGEPLRVANPYDNPDFSARVDKRANHVTREMLTIPLVVDQIPVGVAQFLNRADGRNFSEQDEVMAVAESGRIALKVAEFVRAEENYVQVGLYSPPSPSPAAIMFCDLSASSSLFDVLHESGAITCINDYLSQVADIVLNEGGVIDQYLGDGAMFLFTQDASADPTVVARRAAEAAVASVEAFQVIKQSWLASRLEVKPVFSRIGLAYGNYRETLIGPARHRKRVVLGSGVHRAADLCETSSRKKNVILIDERMASLLDRKWKVRSEQRDGVFELIGRA